MLKALMEYIGSDSTTPEFLNGFSLVKCDYESPSQRRSYYLCLGRHDFFLVPCPVIPSNAGALGAANGEVENTYSQTTLPAHKKNILVVSYRAVQEIVKSVEDGDAMTIVLAPGTLKRMKHPEPVDPSVPPPPRQTLAPLNIVCAERESLLTEFLVCLKASHMFFTFEIHTEELVKIREPRSATALLSLDKSGGVNPALQKEREAVDRSWRAIGDRKKAAKSYLQSYSFYRPGEYDESQRSGSAKRHFERPYVQKHEQLELGQMKTNVRLDAASLHVEQIEPSGERMMSIQSLTERYMREICSHVADWRLRTRPCFYQKKMNLTGDPASWTCWIMKVRTLKGKQSIGATEQQDNRMYEFRHVTVIGCRRNFIPPTMQSHCDFIVTHISQYQDFADGTEEEEVAQLVCDTLSPQASSFERDDLVVQATADALLLDDPSYFWYESELRVRPRAHAKAREFCRSLFELLLETPIWTDNQKLQFQGLVDDWERQYGSTSVPSSALQQQGPTTLGSTKGRQDTMNRRKGVRFDGEEEKEDRPSSRPLDEDNGPETLPMRIARIAEELEAQAPGLDPETDSNHADWVAWRIRVWRYLAYCADGAVYKDVLNLDMLTKAWKHNLTDKVVRQTIARVLDKFIHLRQVGEEYKPDELHQKAASERLMNSCAFNERVMVRLLKPTNGYIQSVLSAHDMYLYPKFLVRLLCRNEDAANSAAGDTGNVNQSGTSGGESWLSGGGGGSMADAYDPSEQMSHAVLKCLVIQSSSAGKMSSSQGADLIRSTSDLGAGSIAKPATAGTMAPSSAAAEDKAHDIALNILVPALIRIFMSHPEDEKLRTFVIAILVNFSRNNYSVKANILAGGFAREIVKLLKSKDDDLVRHACSLLTNLTKTTDFRTTIYRGSTKSSLLDLVRRNHAAASVPNLPDSDKYRSPKIISQACQVLGNLAIDPSIRADLLKDDELQHDADGNFSISTVVRTLADLVCKDDYLATFKQTPKDRADLDEVRASALFALKNLSISPGATGASMSGAGSSAPGVGQTSAGASEPATNSMFRSKISTKSALGRYASKDFLKILKDKDVKDRNLIDYLLRLLYSLCYEPKVALKLQAEKIQDGLALRKQEFANLCLQIQTKIANQQKALTIGGGASGGVVGAGYDEDADAGIGSGGTVGIQGGILKQTRFARG